MRNRNVTRTGRLLADIKDRPFFWGGWSCLGLVIAVVLGVWQWSEYHFRAAEIAAAEYDYAAAYEHCRLGLQVPPRRFRSQLLAARWARQAQRYPEAKEHLQAGEALKPKDEALLRERVLYRVETGELSPEAEQFLETRIRENDPELPILLESFARGYTAKMQLLKARRCLDQCIELQPDHFAVLFARAQLLERLTRFGQAVHDYRRVVQLKPGDDTVRLRCAQTLAEIGAWQEALGHFEVLKDRQSENPEVLLGLALCRAQGGDASAAVALLERALSKDPGNSRVLRERGRLALEAGQAALAEDWLRRATHADPSDRSAVYLLAQCFQAEHKTEEAKAQFARSDQLFKDLARFGELFEEMDKDPLNHELHHELGLLYLRNGQEAKALNCFRNTLNLNPSHRLTHRILADYYSQKGDVAQAAEHRLLAE